MTKLRLQYQTIEFGETDIHLCTLRDKQQFDDPDDAAKDIGISSAQWPLFGVIWPSSVILAELVDGYCTEDKRILEIGCGMALPSLLLNSKAADITATDYHPETENFLERNASLNDDETIPYERTGWADLDDELGIFDLIIGSDILYEDEHAELLARFINDHAKPVCEIILVDAGRGGVNKMIRAMVKLNYESEVLERPKQSVVTDNFKGRIVRFSRDAV